MSATFRPLVTVGIPTYQRPELFAVCLQEIVSQTYTNLEIIVGDNGGPNPAMDEIIAGYAGDSRIKYVRHAENLGAIGNFQYLIKAATGTYFMWSADDDHRKPDFVEVLVDALEKTPDAILAMTDIDVFHSNGEYHSFQSLCSLQDPQDWPEQRQRFFQFPITDCNFFYAIYGIYRREAILPLLPILPKMALSAWGSEYTWLSGVATRGRILGVEGSRFVFTYSDNAHQQSLKAIPTSTFAGFAMSRALVHCQNALASPLPLGTKLYLAGSVLFSGTLLALKLLAVLVFRSKTTTDQSMFSTYE